MCVGFEIKQIECQDFVDIDVFQEAKKVIDALQNREVAPALAWCADNKSRLKKSKVHAGHSFLKIHFFKCGMESTISLFA